MFKKRKSENSNNLDDKLESNSGKDEYGLWMSLDYKDTHQVFRWCDPGQFLMGSPLEEMGRDRDETQRLIEFSEGFWIADTCVTQAMWVAFMGSNPSAYVDSENSVENVAYDDAIEFLQKFQNEFALWTASLPTEAQWEYACRAGTTTPFSFGDYIDSTQVNFDGTFPYADSPRSQYRKKTVHVKSLIPNNWGIHEMHGNVWEWCSDYYAVYKESKDNSAIIDPMGPPTGDTRVMRGGSWFNDAGGCRSAYRVRNSKVTKIGNIGFRILLTAA